MNAAVIYATRTGNTKRVAETIAATLRETGAAELFSVDEAPPDLGSFDLIVIGGPTEAHGTTPPMTNYLDRVNRASIQHRPVAAFDTRLAWPKVLSGSAAGGIARATRIDERKARRSAGELHRDHEARASDGRVGPRGALGLPVIAGGRVALYATSAIGGAVPDVERRPAPRSGRRPQLRGDQPLSRG